MFNCSPCILISHLTFFVAGPDPRIISLQPSRFCGAACTPSSALTPPSSSLTSSLPSHFTSLAPLDIFLVGRSNILPCPSRYPSTPPFGGSVPPLVLSEPPLEVSEPPLGVSEAPVLASPLAEPPNLSRPSLKPR